MLDKRHFKKVFTEFNFGRTIEIRKGDVFYIGRIDTYEATNFYDNFDECLEKCREMVSNMPGWLVKAIGK